MAAELGPEHLLGLLQNFSAIQLCLSRTVTDLQMNTNLEPHAKLPGMLKG